MNLSTQTVETLRKSGYKVRVKHYRYYAYNKTVSKIQKLMAIREIEGKKRHSKGGLTIVEIDGPQGSFVGKAICSRNDNFCYKTGVKIALGRMEEKTSFDFWGLAKKVADFFNSGLSAAK